MKYLAIVLIIFLVFSSVAVTYAATTYPIIKVACESKTGALFSFDDGFSIFKNYTGKYQRIVALGGASQKLKMSDFYLKSTEQINATPNVAITVGHGCDEGDMAISGGLDNYTSPPGGWRTISSGPSAERTTPNSLMTTVIFEGQTPGQPTFRMTTNCLRLEK